MSEGTRKELSQLDPGGVLKNSHSMRADALRVINANTLVGEFFTRADITYNGNGSAISADFYYDRQRAEYTLTFVNDVNSSLAGKYLLLDTVKNNPDFYVYFKVDGVGTDPAIAGKTGIAVNISENDVAQTIAFAFKLALAAYSQFSFSVDEAANVGKLVYVDFGQVVVTDIDTGIQVLQLNKGESILVKSIELPYENGVKYVYNEYEKTFVIFAPLQVTLESSSRVAFIENIVMPLANTEYSFTLPDNTKRFTIKLREDNAELKIKYSSGGDYFILNRGNSYDEMELDTNNVTIYFETTYTGKNVELIYWS